MLKVRVVLQRVYVHATIHARERSRTHFPVNYACGFSFSRKRKGRQYPSPPLHSHSWCATYNVGSSRKRDRSLRTLNYLCQVHIQILDKATIRWQFSNENGAFDQLHVRMLCRCAKYLAGAVFCALPRSPDCEAHFD